MFGSYFKRYRPKKATTVTAHFSKYRALSRKIILSRVAHFAPLCGVEVKRIAIRNQRRRWGSCSSLGNLNFHYRLIFLPTALCDYVVVHELCHLKQLNHGPAFWAEVEKVMPEYKKYEAELRAIEKVSGAAVKHTAHLETSYYGEILRTLAVVK